MVNLVIFNALGAAGFRIGIVFYIWLGIVNMFLVSQFWAFANDLYTEGQGRRLFPMIGVGASLGAWVGAATVSPLVQRAGLSAYTLMLLGAGTILAALALTIAANRRETQRTDPVGQQAEQVPLGKEGGFQLILKDRYLLWIAVLTVLLNVVNSTGGFLLTSLVVAEAIARFGTDAASQAPAARVHDRVLSDHSTRR